MASFGRHNKRVRRAWYKKDFEAWQEAMMAKGSYVIIKDTIHPPWDEVLDDPTEWDNDLGVRVEKSFTSDYLNEWNPKNIKMAFPRDPNDKYRSKGRSINIDTDDVKEMVDIVSHKPHGDDGYKPIVVGAPGIDIHHMGLTHHSIGMAGAMVAAGTNIGKIGSAKLIDQFRDPYKSSPEIHFKEHSPKWDDCIMSVDEGHPDGDSLGFNIVRANDKDIFGFEELLEKLRDGEIPIDKSISIDSIGSGYGEINVNEAIHSAKKAGYNIRSLWDKIRCNSEYPLTANKSIPMFNPDMATSITEHARDTMNEANKIAPEDWIKSLKHIGESTITSQGEVDLEFLLHKKANGEIEVKTVKERNTNHSLPIPIDVTDIEDLVDWTEKSGFKFNNEHPDLSKIDIDPDNIVGEKKYTSPQHKKDSKEAWHNRHRETIKPTTEYSHCMPTVPKTYTINKQLEKGDLTNKDNVGLKGIEIIKKRESN